MEQFRSDCKSGETSKTVSIVDFDENSTQDATDFESDELFDHDIEQSNDDDTAQINNRHVNDVNILKLDINNYFKDFTPKSVLSPISELAMNVAMTKLTSASNVTGKFSTSFCLMLCSMLIFEV